MGKAIARKSKATIVRECIKDPTMFKYIINKISRILQSELRRMCAVEVNSVLKQQLPKNFSEFTWDILIKEAEVYAPVLLAILNACTTTKTPRSNRLGTIGMCIAILLKYRYDKMCLVQKILSLILYAGHSGKEVCMYHFNLLYYFECLGISKATKVERMCVSPSFNFTGVFHGI